MKTILLSYMLAVSAAAAEESAPLGAMMKDYEKAMAKAAVPVREAYYKRLAALMADSVRAGNLEQALAVQRRLVAVCLEGRWVGRDAAKSYDFWFNAEGRTGDGEWRIEGETILTSENGGWSLHFPIPKGPTTRIEGKMYFKGKPSHDFSLTRK